MLKKLLSILILNLMISGIRCDSSEEEELYECMDGKRNISSVYQCDGKNDCEDGSDDFMESGKHSSQCLESICGKTHAQCNYGACIQWEKFCDGPKDCADESDEWKRNCNDADDPNTLSCDSGQILPKERFCDGEAHCFDKSDEFEKYCWRTQCNEKTQFKCESGGCIDAGKLCDKKYDCWDKSDESKAFAKCAQHTGPNDVTPTPMPTGCNISVDQNSEVLNENEIGYLAGVNTLPIDTSVSITCVNGYHLSTNEHKAQRTCLKHGWNADIPKCIRYCNADVLKRSISTVVTCSYDLSPVSCQDIKPKTIAKISCADSYRVPDRIRKTANFKIDLKCKQNSEWNIDKYNCQPQCGIVAGYQGASKAPWNVRIKAQGIYGCEGVILSPKLVITAKHCVTDEDEEVLNEKFLQVTAGYKFENNQTSNVTENVLHVYPLLDDDVAVLELSNPFILSMHIRPICYNSEIPWFASEPFVKSSRMSQGGLKFTKIPLESSHNCSTNLGQNQFCVRQTGRMENPKDNLCEGFSGSGVIKESNGKHHLIGIISSKPSRTFNCTTEPVVAVDIKKIIKNLKAIHRPEVDYEQDT